MENITMPVAVSGLRGADKIRSVIYANHQLAHVPLTEILKLAVQIGQSGQSKQSGIQDCNEKQEAVLPNIGGHFIRLSETLLIQYGFAAAGRNESGNVVENLINVRFPLGFAAADYCPCICACAGQEGAAFTAFIAAESLQKTGFAAHITPLSLQTGNKPAGASPAHASGIFWLAIGFAA